MFASQFVYATPLPSPVLAGLVTSGPYSVDSAAIDIQRPFPLHSLGHATAGAEAQQQTRLTDSTLRGSTPNAHLASKTGP